MKNRSVKFIFIVLVLCLAAATLAMGAFASSSGEPATETDTTEAPQYTITCIGDNYGWVTVSQNSAAAGETITVHVYPDPGYELDRLSATGVTLTTGSYTFTMPDRDVTITATFKVAEYSVTATAGENGSITVSQPNNTISNEKYVYDELVTVTVTACRRLLP